MTKFGYSLPPGCGTLPGEEEQAIDLLPFFKGNLPHASITACWWLEDGTILVNADVKLACEWDSAKTDYANCRAACGVVRAHFRPINRLLARALRLINAEDARLNAERRGPVPTFADWAAEMPFPAGDFKWDDDEGSTVPWFDDDDDTYHTSTYSLEFERNGGALTVRAITGDCDGNSECDAEFTEGEGGTWWADFYRDNLIANGHGLGWANYHEWCAQDPSRGDPLGDFIGGRMGQLEHAKAACEYAAPPRRPRRASRK